MLCISLNIERERKILGNGGVLLDDHLILENAFRKEIDRTIIMILYERFLYLFIISSEEMNIPIYLLLKSHYLSRCVVKDV